MKRKDALDEWVGALVDSYNYMPTELQEEVMDFLEIDEEVLDLDASDDVNGTRSRRTGSVQSNTDSEEEDRGVLTNFEDLDEDERITIRESAFCQDGSALDIIDDVIDDFNLNNRMSLPNWSEAAATVTDVSAATAEVYAHTSPPALIVPQSNAITTDTTLYWPIGP